MKRHRRGLVDDIMRDSAYRRIIPRHMNGFGKRKREGLMLFLVT